MKKFSSSRNFSQGMHLAQQVHSWMNIDLGKAGKLLRGETNSQILKYFTFSAQNLRFLTTQLKHDFPANRITLRARQALRITSGHTKFDRKSTTLREKSEVRNEEANKDVEHIESMQNLLVFLGF